MPDDARPEGGPVVVLGIDSGAAVRRRSEHRWTSACLNDQVRTVIGVMPKRLVARRRRLPSQSLSTRARGRWLRGVHLLAIEAGA